jgi:serine/threonine-protein kinase HipA
VENILSQSLRFGLKPFKAKKMLQEVTELCSEWQAYYNNNGVGAGDIERLKNIIPTTFY